MLGVGVASMIIGPVSAEALAQAVPIALAGAAVFAFGALPLPRWAKLRQRQMDELAERLTAETP